MRGRSLRDYKEKVRCNKILLSSWQLCDIISITERARLQAEAKAAEDARKKAEAAAAAEAAAEAKRQRELEREAARKALQEVISAIRLPPALSCSAVTIYMKHKYC